MPKHTKSEQKKPATSKKGGAKPPKQGKKR